MRRSRTPTSILLSSYEQALVKSAADAAGMSKAEFIRTWFTIGAMLHLLSDEPDLAWNLARLEVIAREGNAKYLLDAANAQLGREGQTMPTSKSIKTNKATKIIRKRANQSPDL